MRLFYSLSIMIMIICSCSNNSNLEYKTKNGIKIDSMSSNNPSNKIVTSPNSAIDSTSSFVSIPKDTNIIFKTDKIETLDSISTQTIKNLPFGCEKLITYKFPETWESQGEEAFSQPEGINKIHNKVIYEIVKYYNDMNHW